ncbi:ABC-type Co2+ transport system permease subunit [Sulfitobacter undariae]|uniref:ABC-type Co2+ transport system permease subunit n=1 Tax=Sulfitobacter undariae TaxID=1563671 RepID=A0A7W6E8Q5_9RHOB|nr:energy-coupling factor ABC transporter permease [Sulfitobacter undariae]MBB3994080.1 ABC-type Co2+ transport system permease subunit [Sulfitobacter undariae]
MHIEPGVVDGAKMVFAYGTAAVAAGYSLKLINEDLRTHSAVSFGLRSVIAAVGVFIFFEVLPHFAVGISEVHLILGTTLFLLLGSGPATIGLAGGLAIQGLLFAPSDVPMYFVNVSTLLFPLFAVDALAKKVIPKTTAYVDLRYRDVLKMSAVYQGGVVVWVAFWATYGQGVGVDNLAAVAGFGAAYLLVILIEPVVDLAALAGAKSLQALTDKGVFTQRLHSAS